ncbi:uncharacterized protein LOC143153645 [Ptiloglossa arizonensis]|uniref:uncharacterized protein LOC143153645 n=1 Tax=Ptiloglossa arizonensis TaxID=3350558 RepID=UPI003FA037D9
MGGERAFVQGAVASRRQASSQCAVKMPGWERVDRGRRASVVAVSTPRLPGRGKEADSGGSSKAQLGSAERKCALYVLTAASRTSCSSFGTPHLVRACAQRRVESSRVARRVSSLFSRGPRVNSSCRVAFLRPLTLSLYPYLSVFLSRSVSIAPSRSPSCREPTRPWGVKSGASTARPRPETGGVRSAAGGAGARDQDEIEEKIGGTGSSCEGKYQETGTRGFNEDSKVVKDGRSSDQILVRRVPRARQRICIDPPSRSSKLRPRYRRRVRLGHRESLSSVVVHRQLPAGQVYEEDERTRR